jgi:hypothetical protein
LGVETELEGGAVIWDVEAQAERAIYRPNPPRSRTGAIVKSTAKKDLILWKVTQKVPSRDSLRVSKPGLMNPTRLTMEESVETLENRSGAKAGIVEGNQKST